MVLATPIGRAFCQIVVATMLAGCNQEPNPSPPTTQPSAVTAPVAPAQTGLTWDDLRQVTITELRTEQEQRPLLDYVLIVPADSDLLSTADLLLQRGWEMHGHTPFPLTTPIDWNLRLAEDRSWNFELHTWDPLNILLQAYQETQNRDYLQPCIRIARDWIETYPTQGVAESPVPDQPSFAWYDMAVGLRCHRLAYLLDVLCRDDSYSDEIIQILWHSLIEHQIHLENDRHFASHNNHGFFQAAGQWAAARRFANWQPMHKATRQAHDRIADLLDRQFTSEGVHTEHSPAYHRMVYQSFVGIVHAGIFDDDDAHRARVTAIEDALAWMIQPNGTLTMFGDTDHEKVEMPVAPSLRPTSPHLLAILSGERLGHVPDTRLKAFPESGLVVMRSHLGKNSTGFADASYLAQQCAFHSRTHKHADDLSFVWFDRGLQILIDPGRYGYLGRTPKDSSLRRQGFWYADPRRIYVESTRAHNTVEIDGQSYNRATTPPYGSALVQWGESGDLLFAESDVLHQTKVRHRRMLILSPGRWLLVWDDLHDEQDTRHDYRQWFQFAPDLDVRVADTERLSITNNSSEWHLHAFSIVPSARLANPIRGQTEPELQGFWAPSSGIFEPVWSACWEQHAAADATFATLFTFAHDAEPDRTATMVDAGNKARFVWYQDGETHTLSVSKKDDGTWSLMDEVKPSQ